MTWGIKNSFLKGCLRVSSMNAQMHCELVMQKLRTAPLQLN